MAKSVYDIIKKQNGESFARVLRDKGLLDIPDIVDIVKYAGHTAQDAEQLFPYLWSLKKFQETENTTPTDPFQLLDMAGYHAYEVHNLDEQNSLRRFFRQNEELCTFRDIHRYEYNYIIHAVKHDVWRDPYAIRPAKNPQRQDEYGTSVISIQIRKSGGFISIKNRYNHTVSNPDQTFNSTPDEIIPGLSAALKGYFDVDWQSTGVSLPKGFILNGNQILKTNFEVNNCYFGDGFFLYARSGQFIETDKSNQVQLDYFIWDNKQKKLLNPSYEDDCFPDIFNAFIQDKKVTISGKAPNQTILVDGEKVIEIENNHIVTLNMPNIEIINNNFLAYNKKLQSIQLPHVKKIGAYFLVQNKNLQSIDLPLTTEVGKGFLSDNKILQSINMAALTNIDYNFMCGNENLRSISLPNVNAIGTNFLRNNTDLQSVSLPNVNTIGNNFLLGNIGLKSISLPNANIIGDNFLQNNTDLKSASLPNANIIGDSFLYCNTGLQSISLPRANTIANNFLFSNTGLQSISLPSVTNIGDHFLSNNRILHDISMPVVTHIGHDFLRKNTNLQSLSLPAAVNIGTTFLVENNQIKHLYAPNLESVSYCFLRDNTALSQIDLPSLKSVGEQFLLLNENIKYANLPNLESAGILFLQHNKKLKRLSLPNLTKLSGGFMEYNNGVILDLPRLNSVTYNGQSRPATPTVSTPITDIFPERRNIAQKFRAAIKKLHEKITITYSNQFDNDK